MSIQKKFQLFLVCISYLGMSSNLSLSAPRLPFYWTPPFFVILGLFSFSVMLGLEPDISLTDSRVKLSPPLSLPDLIRQSRDSPVEPGNDEKEKKHDNDKKKKSTGMTSK